MRASHPLSQEGQNEYKPIFDIAPVYFSAKSAEELRASILYDFSTDSYYEINVPQRRTMKITHTLFTIYATSAPANEARNPV